MSNDGSLVYGVVEMKAAEQNHVILGKSSQWGLCMERMSRLKKGNGGVKKHS
jgi:hypothetical protein